MEDDFEVIPFSFSFYRSSERERNWFKVTKLGGEEPVRSPHGSMTCWGVVFPQSACPLQRSPNHFLFCWAH